MYIPALKPEFLLYLYMAACIAVLIFNIIYIIVDRYQGSRFKKNSLDMCGMIEEQIEDVQKTHSLGQAYTAKMTDELKHVERLRAFQCSMEEIREKFPEEDFKNYIRQMRKVFLPLAVTYAKRDVIEQAYFAKIIETLGVDEGQESFDGLIDFLLHMVTSGDVYVRENALRALYSIGNQDAVLSAWEKMEDNDILHSMKLLADGLLSFKGDRLFLAKLLFKHKGKFSTGLFLPVMQFIRFFTGSFQEQFMNIMQDETEDKELRLEAVRYFRKYPYEPVREMLYNYIRYQEYIDWEYGAMAAVALSSYPCADTIECLKEGLGASNWYVRLNCAESLINGLEVPESQLFDIYNGRDRYAREILRYAAQRAKINEQEMEIREENV